MTEIEIYCAGVSSEEEKSGWGAILISGKHRREISGLENGNSQRMALLAVIKGLEEIKIEKSRVKLFVPIKLFARCIQENWLEVWQKNGWMTKDKTKVKNADLWEKLIPLLAKHQCQFFRPEDAPTVAKIEASKKLAKKAIQEKTEREKAQKIPLFRVEIAVNLIPEENILPEKINEVIKKIILGIKNELSPKTLDVTLSGYQEKKEEQKKERVGEEIQKYSEELLKNPNSWNALFGRGVFLMKKGEKESAKVDFKRFLELSKNSENEQILRDREQILSWFPELI